MQPVDCVADVEATVCAGAKRALMYIEVVFTTKHNGPFTEMRSEESVARYTNEATGEWVRRPVNDTCRDGFESLNWQKC